MSCLLLFHLSVSTAVKENTQVERTKGHRTDRSCTHINPTRHPFAMFPAHLSPAFMHGMICSDTCQLVVWPMLISTGHLWLKKGQRLRTQNSIGMTCSANRCLRPVVRIEINQWDTICSSWGLLSGDLPGTSNATRVEFVLLIPIL